MANVKELKEMIVNLKVQLVRANIPRGHCPYAYYSTSKKKERSCDIDCDQCQNEFLKDIEKDIREEVDKL